MISFLIKGGPVMGILFVCSVVGVSILIQKYLVFKSNPVKSGDVDDLVTMINTVGIDSATQHLSLNFTLQNKVLKTVLESVQFGKDAVQESVSQVMAKELPKLERSMNLLSSLITIAPILGLMGTVLGLIDVFNVISGGGIGDSTLLSKGIAEALITTVTGLGITIPLVVAYNYFESEIEKRMGVLNAMVTTLVQAFSKADTES